MPVVIARCKCKSVFQDQKYGAGNRVHNTLKGFTGMRCTVCGNTIHSSISKKDADTAPKAHDVKTTKSKVKLDRDKKSRETRRK